MNLQGDLYASQAFHSWTKNLIDMWTEQINSDENDFARIELVNSFKKIYPEVIRYYTSPNDDVPTFDEILPHLQDVIFDTNIELISQPLNRA